MLHTYERSAHTLIHASNFLIFAKPNLSFLNALRITLEGTVVSVFSLTLRDTLKMDGGLCMLRAGWCGAFVTRLLDTFDDSFTSTICLYRMMKPNRLKSMRA